jgi:hypothetical protein
LADPLEKLGVEEAMAVMRERVGSDGTVALVSLFRHSQEEILRLLDARFAQLEAGLERRFTAVEARIDQVREELGSRMGRLEARVERLEVREGGLETQVEGIKAHLRHLDARFDQVNARIDGTLRYAVTFCLFLLGLVAAVATAFLALER